MKNNIKKVFGIKTLILSVLILIGIQATAFAQRDTIQLKPSFWVGAAVGANLNYYDGTTQDINANLLSFPAFHKGSGVGLYLAPTLIYHNPDKLLGVMLQVGYDSRKGKFDQVTTPCNCPADLKTNLSYITIEPSLRLAPFKGNFYMYGGPRLAFNVGKSFKYDRGASADGLLPAQPQLKGDFTNMHKSVYSLNIGAGYDILLSEKIKGSAEEGQTYKQVVLSPFVDFHPYFGQNPRSIETWNLTTLRIGAVLKFGHVHVAAKAVPVVVIVPVIIVKEPEPEVVVVPVVVVVPEPVIITTTYTLFFKFDKSNLDAQTIKNLNALIIDLKHNSRIGVDIKSYADIRGTNKYNISLSERRGKAVVGYLTSNGIDASRINSKGLGETTVFNKNNNRKINEVNYALNRRSNLVVDIATKK